MILGVLGRKGGIGETTLSRDIAAHHVMQERRVLIVDADPQGSTLTWSNVREGTYSSPSSAWRSRRSAATRRPWQRIAT